MHRNKEKKERKKDLEKKKERHFPRLGAFISDLFYGSQRADRQCDSVRLPDNMATANAKPVPTEHIRYARM